MAIISFGKIDRSLIVVIIGCIFCFFNRLLSQVDSRLYKNPILNVICMGPSRFLTVIPLIIFIIKSYKKNSYE